MEPNPQHRTVNALMEAMMELSGAAQVVEACNRLTEALTAAAATQPPAMPGNVRADMHRVIALLALPRWEEVVAQALRLEVDLRELTAEELAYLSQVTTKTVGHWRIQGVGGPRYRLAGGRALYRLSDVHEWMLKGRQTMTAQGMGKGRRAS